MIDMLLDKRHPGVTNYAQTRGGICHTAWPQFFPEEAVDKTACIMSAALRSVKQNKCVTNGNDDCINK